MVFLPTYSELLGGRLLGDWDARLGAAHSDDAGTEKWDSWTDQVQGIVKVAPASVQRPVYAADGSNFRGLPVVQCNIANQRCLRNNAIGFTFLASGSRPYIRVVGRMRNVPDGSTQNTIAGSGRFAVGDDLRLWSNSSGSANLTYQQGNSAAYVASVPGVHAFEGLDDGTLKRLFIDGVEVATGTSNTLGSNTTGVWVGTDASGSHFFDFSVARVAYGSEAPTAAERNTMMAIDRSDWGF